MRSGPFRRDDLTYTDGALQQRLEELLAFLKIPLANIHPVSSGYIICGVPPFEISRLWEARAFREHLWSRTCEVDSVGTTVQVSKNPSAMVALSIWMEVPALTAILRRDFIGEALWMKHQSGLLNVVAQQLTDKFHLVSHPANSLELPSITKLAWGYLVQLPPAELNGLSDLLYLPAIKDWDLPVTHELGGHLLCVLAVRPQERIKLALVFNSMEQDPIYDFQHWLRHKTEPVGA
jgi:hypothetical protein